MTRDTRYDILFEPVPIGPVTAKNRFFQVPHCNGMGSAYPKSMAAMREVKAEGGWAVVCTEETEIHPSSDWSPLIEGRLWDDRDIPHFAHMTERVHAHDALAGVELSHSGHRDGNLYSRAVPLSVSHQPIATDHYPAQARAMDKADIREFRHWHRQAALRARTAGFDVIYVYCRIAASLVGMFLSPDLNDRVDEYGGSLTNRLRLLRELLEDTRDAVGESCAVALRYTVDDLPIEESRAVVESLADLPDLWDVNAREWRRDSMPSRFGPEGSQEELIAFVKQVTNKPVVGVGRFTSPDAMVSQIKRGIVDFIGAARPSIADPFLPRKIEDGRLDEIRECIGCNICISGEFTIVPMRCTQNPTMGEEWRRGWHPERIEKKRSDDRILVVGGGPAGLECSLALSKRGHEVILAEARDFFGGRVSQESRLPGLSAWARVRDHRLQILQGLSHVSLYMDSELDGDSALEVGADRIVVATGAAWRRDGVGRHHHRPMPDEGAIPVLTPDDLFAGERPPPGHVVLFDDDHYYMGGVLAELLCREGWRVTMVTPAAEVSSWSQKTLEQTWVEERLLEVGVQVMTKWAPVALTADGLDVQTIRGSDRRRVTCDGVVMVTSRLPKDKLYHDLKAREYDWAETGVKSVTRIGDCLAPSIIAAAVHAGHRFARELDAPSDHGIGFRREAYD